MTVMSSSFSWQDSFSFTCRIKETIPLLMIMEGLAFAPRGYPISSHVSIISLFFQQWQVVSFSCFVSLPLNFILLMDSQSKNKAIALLNFSQYLVNFSVQYLHQSCYFFEFLKITISPQQIYKLNTLCCFKPPGLWRFFIDVPGN